MSDVHALMQEIGHAAVAAAVPLARADAAVKNRALLAAAVIAP